MRTISLYEVTMNVNGGMQVKLLKKIIDEGEEIFSEPHVFPIPPELTVDDKVTDINSWLVANKYPELDEADIQTIRDVWAIGAGRQDVQGARDVAVARVAGAAARAVEDYEVEVLNGDAQQAR